MQGVAMGAVPRLLDRETAVHEMGTVQQSCPLLVLGAMERLEIQ